MRIVVLVLGLIGAIISAIGGLATGAALEELRPEIETNLKLADLVTGGATLTTEQQKLFDAAVEAYRRIQFLPLLMYVGAGLGVVGAFLGFVGRRFGSASVLFVAAVGPVLFSPLSIVFSGLLGLAALFALFIGPKRRERYLPENET